MKNGHDLVLEAEKSCAKVKSFSFMNTTADVFHTVYFNSQSISNDVISRCRWRVCSSENLRVLFKTLHVQLVRWWSPDSQPTLPCKAHADSQLFCKKKKKKRERERRCWWHSNTWGHQECQLCAQEGNLHMRRGSRSKCPHCSAGRWWLSISHERGWEWSTELL